MRRQIRFPHPAGEHALDTLIGGALKRKLGAEFVRKCQVVGRVLRIDLHGRHHVGQRTDARAYRDRFALLHPEQRVLAHRVAQRHEAPAHPIVADDDEVSFQAAQTVDAFNAIDGSSQGGVVLETLVQSPLVDPMPDARQQILAIVQPTHDDDGLEIVLRRGQQPRRARSWLGVWKKFDGVRMRDNRETDTQHL